MGDAALSDPHAVVLDIGSSNTTWGYSGDDEPRQCFTSSWCQGEEKWIDAPADFLQLRENCQPYYLAEFNNLPPPFKEYVGTAGASAGNKMNINGRTSKDLIKRTCEYINKTFPSEDTLKGKALLVSQPTKSTTAYCKPIAELAFESIGVGAFFSVRKAPLCAFALGRPTSCVVEMGPVGLTVSPVYECYTLQRYVQQYAIGGWFFDWLLASQFKLWDNTYPAAFNSGFNPYRGTPDLATVNPAYLHHSRKRIIEDFKENCVSVSELKGRADYKFPEDRDDIPYELPDGEIVHVSSEVSSGIPEFMFSTDAPVARSILNPLQDDLSSAIRTFPGLPTAIVSAAFSCDVDIRPMLLQNVVVAGGPAAMDGLMERLSLELSQARDVDVSYRDRWISGGAAGASVRDVSSMRFKVAAQSAFERRFTTWMGGSIVASLSSFESLWISKLEWAEFGETILDRRLVF